MQQPRQQTNTETNQDSRLASSLESRSQLQFGWIESAPQADEPRATQHEEMEPERWDGMS